MRQKILKQITAIEDNYCRSCTINEHIYCIRECKVGKKLKNLGDKLLDISNERSRDILSKGSRITADDLVYLLERGYTQKRVGNELGLSERATTKLFKGIKKRGQNFDGTNRDVVYALLDQGFTVQEICDRANIPYGTVSHYQWKYRRLKSVQRDSKCF